MGDITFALRGGEAWRSPWADYRRLRDESPVHFVPAAGDNTDFHVLSRSRMCSVPCATRRRSRRPRASPRTPSDDDVRRRSGPIVMMDPPDHTAMRRLVGKQMTPRRVSQIEGAVGAFVDARLDRVADAGGSPVDIVEVLFKPLPSFIVAHYLGVPAETRANFDEWTNAIVAANAEGSFESAMDGDDGAARLRRRVDRTQEGRAGRGSRDRPRRGRRGHRVGRLDRRLRVHDGHRGQRHDDRHARRFCRTAHRPARSATAAPRSP